MCKDSSSFAIKQALRKRSDSLNLDKLGQLGTNSKVVLKNRAKAKFFTHRLAIRLALLPDTVLSKSYWRSYHCNSVLTVVDGKIKGTYCDSRWCSVCNRIRMAKMIKSYSKPLSAFADPHFVTLTIPNCIGTELAVTFRTMISTFKRIMEAMKKRRQRGNRSYQILGIRKLECTKNVYFNTFHPHFHLIIEGVECANEIVKEWLLRFPLANPKAQNVKMANKGSLIELFKYTVKPAVKNKSGRYSTDLQALDTIYTAMIGLRLVQPIGIRCVSEDVSGIVSQSIELDDNVYIWNDLDWYGTQCGSALTGYEPTSEMINIVNSFT